MAFNLDANTNKRRIEILGVDWHTRWFKYVEGHGLARIAGALVAFEASVIPGEECNPYSIRARNVLGSGVVQRRHRAMRHATLERFAAALNEHLACDPLDAGALPTHRERSAGCRKDPDACYCAKDAKPKKASR